MIERVVVKPAKPLTPRIIRPDPFLESFFDAFLLLSCGLGRLGVDDGFMSTMS